MSREVEAEPMPAIDAYAPEPAPIARRKAGHLAGAWRFLRDPKASRLGKVLLALAVVYVISPIDFIPDVAPIIGWIDDVIVMVIAATYLFRSAQRYR